MQLDKVNPKKETVMKVSNLLLTTLIFLIFSSITFTRPQKELSGGIVYLENIIDRKDQQTFQHVIEKGNVVVDFYADWCKPCNQLNSIMAQVAREFPHITFIKVNIDTFSTIRSHYNIKSIPTLIYFKNGQMISRSMGLMSKSKFASKLKTLYS